VLLKGVAVPWDEPSKPLELGTEDARIDVSVGDIDPKLGDEDAWEIEVDESS
jgi:hypothetical protein